MVNLAKISLIKIGLAMVNSINLVIISLTMIGFV